MTTREELALTVDTAQWEWLRPHLEQGGLIVVSPDLELVEAGFGIAVDDTEAVGEWVAAGMLAKPSAFQVFDWDAASDTMFRILIVSPYVLIQLYAPAVT